jgi:DNA-binding response OmpR family regulator
MPLDDTSGAEASMAVLVVDDDATVVNLVAAVLHRAGIRAEVALDGPGALARLGRGGYRAVLTDLTMPGMSGVQLLREARARGHALPFLVMTAYLVPEAEASLRAEPGVTGLLRKPFDIARLVEQVRALLAAAERGLETAETPLAAVPASAAVAEWDDSWATDADDHSATAPLPLLPLQLVELVTARLRREALVAILARHAAARIARARRPEREAEQGC